MTEPTEDTPEPAAAEPVDAEAEGKAALERAAQTLANVIANPMQVAAENAQMRSEVEGAYRVVRALTKRFAGVGNEIVLTREELLAPPINERLQTTGTRDGGISLTILPVSRAERRRSLTKPKTR